MADDVMVDDVSIGEKDQKDVIKDAPSKSKDEANENHSQQDGADKSVDSNADSKKQFDPEKFRKEAFKQASDWKRKYEDLEGRFSKLESTYTQKLESLVGMMTPKQESSLSDQDKMSLVQLFKMGMQVPEIADMLGINKHQNLEKELQSERQARMEREFDSELESVIGKWTQSYGLNSDEMKQELLDFISSNEIYGKKDYRRGLLQEAGPRGLRRLQSKSPLFQAFEVLQPVSVLTV